MKLLCAAIWATVSLSTCVDCRILAEGRSETYVAPPQKIALLIGVDRYESPDITPLKGCANDVADFEQVLLTKYGFESRGIKTLLNEQATHRKVVEAFQQHLIANAQEGSTVVFYFSGHGSQARDEENGDETDGWDETLCTYDSRKEAVFDITDDEIAGLVHQLRTKSSSVSVVLDSCHSGSATRAPFAPVRRTLPDDRIPPKNPAYATAARGLTECSPIQSGGYTVITACRDDQLSYEMDFGGAMRGVFTHEFVQGLRAAKPNTTLREILELTGAMMSAAIGNQQPTSEGNLERKPFGEAVEAPKPFFLVQRDGADIFLKAGQVHGLTEGSEFDVFPPGANRFDQATEIAKIRLSRVLPFTSEAEPVGPKRDIPNLSRAVETTHAFVGTPFRVYVETSDGDINLEIDAAIQSVPGIARASSGGAADLVIKESAAPNAGANGLILPSSIQFLDPSGTTQFEALSKKDLTRAKLALELRRWSSWIAATNVRNPNGVFSGEFTLNKAGSLDSESKVGFLTGVMFREGDEIELSVKNTSHRPVYFYLLDFTSDGTVAQVYPPPGAHERLLPGKAWRQAAEVVVPGGRNEAFELLKAIMSSKPLDLSGVTNRGRTGTSPPIPNALLQSLVPTPTTPTATWATSERSFKVKR